MKRAEQCQLEYFSMGKKSHTHTDLLENWFKRLRFSTTYVWMNSLLFYCIWKTDKSFFYRHIWWRLWKYRWVLSVAFFLFYHNIHHFQASFMSWIFLEMSHSYSYSYFKILMLFFYLVSNFLPFFLFLLFRIL